MDYLILPSNAVSDEFTDNTNSEFSVRLSRGLQLEDGRWEVGLVEIIYPNTWDNVSGGEVRIRKRELNGLQNVFSVPVESGRYSSIGELMARVNKLLLSFGLSGSVGLDYNDVSNGTKLNVYGADVDASFTDDLAYIFGFTPGRWYGKGRYANETPPDVESGLSSLYVYSDIGDSRVVGNAYVPLLRVVPVEGRRFETIHKEFLKPQYIKVSNARTDVIKVVILTSDGRRIPFRGGQVTVTLHLRRAQP
jgi:hypothetical protein